MRNYTKRKRPFETVLMSKATLCDAVGPIGTALVFIRKDGSQSLGMIMDRRGKELNIDPANYDLKRTDDWRPAVMPLEIQ